MKKLIVLIAAITISTGAFAQSFEWGLKGGLNVTGITNSNGNMKPSIYVGAFAEYRFSDFVGFQPELIYSRQGYKDDISFGDVEVSNTKFRMNYINLPLMVKLYLLDELSLDLGPQFGVMINSKAVGKSDGTTYKEDIEGLKNFDVSFGIGLSYRFLYNWDVSARYNLGLTKVAQVGDDKLKNSVIQIGVGYRF